MYIKPKMRNSAVLERPLHSYASSKYIKRINKKWKSKKWKSKKWKSKKWKSKKWKENKSENGKKTKNEKIKQNKKLKHEIGNKKK